MLGVGNDLVAPNLAGSKLDGEKISKLFSQKTVWLVPETDLLCTESIEPYMCDTVSQIISPQQLNTSAEHIATDLKQPAVQVDDPTTLPSTSSGIGHSPMSSTWNPTTSSPPLVASVDYPTTNVTCQHLSKDEEIQLREMFPDRELESIIANACNMDDAVNRLLSNQDEIGNFSFLSSYIIKPL
jgi:hypothetical protein